MLLIPLSELSGSTDITDPASIRILLLIRMLVVLNPCITDPLQPRISIFI
jgi:hypothetical protein